MNTNWPEADKQEQLRGPFHVDSWKPWTKKTQPLSSDYPVISFVTLEDGATHWRSASSFLKAVNSNPPQ